MVEATKERRQRSSNKDDGSNLWCVISERAASKPKLIVGREGSSWKWTRQLLVQTEKKMKQMQQIKCSKQSINRKEIMQLQAEKNSGS